MHNDRPCHWVRQQIFIFWNNLDSYTTKNEQPKQDQTSVGHASIGTSRYDFNRVAADTLQVVLIFETGDLTNVFGHNYLLTGPLTICLKPIDTPKQELMNIYIYIIPLRIHCQTLGLDSLEVYLVERGSASKWPSKKSTW